MSGEAGGRVPGLAAVPGRQIAPATREMLREAQRQRANTGSGVSYPIMASQPLNRLARHTDRENGAVYSDVMPLDVAAVQETLRADGLDGWLLYDFHGSNPIAAQLAGLTSGAHMTTRRWYYLIPASGSPRALVHAIERHNLDALPGEKT